VGLFSKKAKQVRNALLPGGQTIDVVGESHYQEALEQITGGKTEDSCDLEKWARLIREPGHPYDRNAVAVYIEGRKVGYLNRDDAQEYGITLDELYAEYNLRAVCRASIRGGWRRFDRDGVTVIDEGHYGVKLALATPDDLLGKHELTACDDEDLLAGPPPIGG